MNNKVIIKLIILIFVVFFATKTTLAQTDPIPSTSFPPTPLPGTVTPDIPDVPGLDSITGASDIPVRDATLLKTNLLERRKTDAKFAADALAWKFAKDILKKLTAQTVNWINSGFKGNPAYVTDPGQFFLDTADNTASYFLSNNSSLNKLCSPFKAQVRLALVKNYINEDDGNYACSLSTLKNNYEEFTQDFKQGGWDGWFEITQNSQNNPYGAYLDAKNQLAIQVGTEQNKYQKQLDWGRGFLSFEKCKTRQYGPTETSGLLPATPTPGTFGTVEPVINAGDCLEKETVTPGSVIEGQLQKVLGAEIDTLNAADSLNEIVAALIDQLLSRVLNSVTGLRGANPDSIPNPTVPTTGPVCPTPITPVSLCEDVDRGTILNILNKYKPSNNGITEAIKEIQTLHPEAKVLAHPIRLDKIDFGGGLIVDVIDGAIGTDPVYNGTPDTEGKAWTWIQECDCGGPLLPNPEPGTGPGNEPSV